MKGYRFYEEYGNAKNKRAGISQGNVFALELDTTGRPIYSHDCLTCYGVGAILWSANSPVANCSASPEWLGESCKRISEKEARRIHPVLFDYLDDTPEIYNTLEGVL